MWNDTTDDDIDKLGPMTVTLSSSSGDLPETAILRDGTFRVIYNSTASTHEVTAKLDNEIITLKFNTTEMTIETSDIIISQDQNITVTLPQDFNGTLSIKVNNKTYDATVNNTKSITYEIPDVLPAGIYEISVLFVDAENHIYGMNSTNITVSKVAEYLFDVTQPSDVKVGDAKIITVTLPNDASGNITVTVGEKVFKTEVTGNSTAIEVSGFVEGNNTVKVAYSGDGKYESNTTEFIILAEKVGVVLDDNTLSVEVPKNTVNPNFSITLANDATGNLTVIINNKTYTQELINGSATITVDDLTPADYNATVTYSGDCKYDAITTNASFTVPKVEVPIKNDTLVTETPKGTTTPTFTIALPSDATGNLTVTLNGKKYTKELVNGSATVSIDGLTPGNYNAVIAYSGDGKYDPIISNASVSVPKPVLTAKNFSMLYTSGAKYTVRVTVDGKAVSGKTVTFTINGKKTAASTDKNGYASVKITLPPKTKAYTVTATYLGVKVTNKVTVKSIITAKNLKAKKSAKTLKIKVTLKKVNKKYLKGKTVSLKFKGKTYKVKTNKKGQATFTIKKNVLSKLKVGKKYTYKVTYGKDVVSKKIVVKR